MAFVLDLDPVTGSKIVIKLFTGVENGPEIREKSLKGVLNCCVMKPHLIVDPFQVAIAANKALTAANLTTKTIHSEILFNLSPSKNITQSLQRFGAEDGVTDLLVAVLCKSDESVDQFGEIKGQAKDISKLKELSDFDKIKKEYKIGDDVHRSDYLDVIVDKIATKDFV